jgi:hypothetical protein
MPSDLMNRVGTFVTAACLAASFSIPAAAAEPDSVETHLLPVQGSVYMLHAGTAGNSTVQIGKDGVLVVNALRAGLAPQFHSQIKTLTRAPIRYIVSADLRNTAGNGELAALSRTAMSGSP